MNYRSGGPRSFNTVKRSNREERRKRLRLCEKTLYAIVIVFALLVISAFTLLVCNVAVDLLGRRRAGQEETIQDMPELPTIAYDTVALKYSSVGQTGALVIVNPNRAEYLFPQARNDDEGLVSLSGYLLADVKAPYRLKDSNAQLQRVAAENLDALLNQYYNQTGTSLMVLHAYRSQEDQKNISSGVKEGYSEHHTGLLAALSQGNTYTENFAEQEKRLFEICYQYGFIQRYPTGKSDWTGVTNYGECLRYVGVAHATYIYHNGLCLEEYVEMLRRNHVSTNGIDGKHLAIDTNKDGTADYAVYYVPKNESSDLTAVPVPKGIPYTVSGDNIGGFIVTVTLHS